MIANRLDISIDTVRAHIRNIYKKLHVNSKAEVIAKSLRGDLILITLSCDLNVIVDY